MAEMALIAKFAISSFKKISANTLAYTFPFESRANRYRLSLDGVSLVVKSLFCVSFFFQFEEAIAV
jgi:hypothetical protein